jgi:hypothetical protein
MISEDISVEGFDARSWTNFLSLFSPGLIDRLEEDASESNVLELERGDVREDHFAGTVVVIVNADGRLLRAFHSLRGRIKDLDYAGPSSLATVAKTYRARSAVAVREGTLERIAEDLASRLVRGDDYVTQSLTLFRLIREAVDDGRIALSFDALAGAPVPSSHVIQRALDVILPDDRTLLIALWNGNTIWTAIALRRRAGKIDRVVGPDVLGRFTGPLGGDWRRDHRYLTTDVSSALAPVHLGIFGEVGTFRALLRNSAPGAWAKAAATREIIVHPTPPYVAVAMGADAARAVASAGAKWLGETNLGAFLGPLATTMRSYVQEISSVTSMLGFDPLRALARTLEHDPSRDP